MNSKIKILEISFSFRVGESLRDSEDLSNQDERATERVMDL